MNNNEEHVGLPQQTLFLTACEYAVHLSAALKDSKQKQKQRNDPIVQSFIFFIFCDSKIDRPLTGRHKGKITHYRNSPVVNNNEQVLCGSGFWKDIEFTNYTPIQLLSTKMWLKSLCFCPKISFQEKSWRCCGNKNTAKNYRGICMEVLSCTPPGNLELF